MEVEVEVEVAGTAACVKIEPFAFLTFSPMFYSMFASTLDIFTSKHSVVGV